jgi:hypothetical protein
MKNSFSKYIEITNIVCVLNFHLRMESILRIRWIWNLDSVYGFKARAPFFDPSSSFVHILFIRFIFDWFIDWLFTSLSRIFHLYRDVSTACEGLQNLGLLVCSALRAFEKGGIFIVPHLLWHGVFRSHPKDRPIQSPLTTRMGMRRTCSNPDPHEDVEDLF